MKKIYFIFSAFLLAMMTSCSTGPKEITPTSTEFTSGELAKYIEVEDQPSELTFTEKDGAIPTQYISLKVTLKMIKDGIKNVDARDISFTRLLSVACIKLVDENGVEIQDLSIKSEDMLKLQKLLTGSEGDTEEIVFEGEFHNSDDAPKWFEQACKFTPYLTADISVNGASSDKEESEESEESEETTYSSTGGDFVSAYEEATKELASATSNKDCDKIHDKLMHKLYEITQADPNWKDKLADGGVQKAYKAWDEALENAASEGDHYMFMTFCTPENAIKYCQKLQ